MYETWVFSSAPEFAPRKGVVSITVHNSREDADRQAGAVNMDTTDRYATVRPTGK